MKSSPDSLKMRIQNLHVGEKVQTGVNNLVAIAPPPLSTMHSRVHVGEYVLLRLPSDTLKLVHVVPNRYALTQSLTSIHLTNQTLAFAVSFQLANLVPFPATS